MTIETAVAYRKEAIEKGQGLFGKHLYEILDNGDLNPLVFIEHVGINKKQLKAIVKGTVIPDVTTVGIMADVLQLTDTDRLDFYEKASLSKVVTPE